MSRAFPSMRGHAHGPSRTYRRFDAVHGGCGRVSVRARPQPACSGRARARSTAGISLERVRPKRIRREAANFYELLLFRPPDGGQDNRAWSGIGHSSPRVESKLYQVRSPSQLPLIHTCFSPVPNPPHATARRAPTHASARAHAVFGALFPSAVL